MIIAAMQMAGLMQARVLSGPWLQAVTPHAVTVIVECDTEDSVTVVFGNGIDPERTAATLAADVSSVPTPTWFHTIRLLNLTPMTRYRYSLLQGGVVSPEYFFFTAVEPGDPFRAVWMAGFPVKTQGAALALQYTAHANPMVIFYGSRFLPPLSNSTYGLDSQIKETKDLHSFVPYYSALPPFFCSRGDSGSYIHYPSPETNSVSFYSIDYGDLHVLYLCRNLPLDPASPQYQFARQDIARSRQRWKIVMTDRIVGCPGCPDDPDFSRLIREELAPGGVDIILSSSPHRYHHQPLDGIHYLVAGLADDVFPSDTLHGFTGGSGTGNPLYLIIDVSASRIKIFVQNAYNQQMDMIDLWK